MEDKNKYVNQVVVDGEILIDLTKDTVTSNVMLEGETAHAANGTIIVGTIVNGEEIDF